LHVTVDPVTNRFTGSGYTYDANGNTKTTGGMTLAYDAANRVSAVGNEGYLYGGDNLRMYKSKNGSEELHVYGAYGERLGVYSIQAIPGGGPPTYYFTMASTALYFAGRLLEAQDRLGSVGTYYPYGEEYAPTGQDGDKYATYFGDAATNLQYAKNRYYSSAMGRFLTPDPYRASGGPADPASWNRYGYVKGDPVNFNDPRGLDVPADWIMNVYGSADPLETIMAALDMAVTGNVRPGLGFWGPGAPSGGAAPSPPLEFLPKDNARKDLAKKKCYQMLGFRSAAEAQAWLDTIKFNYNSYGELQVRGGVPATEPAAAFTLGYPTAPININTDYNWKDFSKVPKSTGGTFDYLNFWNKQLGTSMTSDELGALVVIHELRHERGDSGEGIRFNKRIYNDCISGPMHAI
jgi:RHS repeat-associated protein